MLAKDLVQLTSRLIKYQTFDGNFKAKKNIIAFVKKQFVKENVYIKEYIQSEFPSIVITLKKEKSPDIFLNGHLDVVPALQDDFIPKIKNNKIYGRGSGDMKGDCAVMIEVMKYFAQQKNRPSLGLMLTTDEECGGRNGVEYLIKKEKYSAKIAIVPDGGQNLETIISNEKGGLRLRLRCYGRSAHSSRPYRGKNAIDELIQTYLKIRKIFPEIKEGEWRDSLNLSLIQGGDIINKVPDYAEASIDIRYVKEWDGDKIFQKIKEINPNVEFITKSSVFIQPKNNLYIKQYKKIAEQELGKTVNFLKVAASSDARFFTKQGIPTILTKVSCNNIHAENEWVDIREMEIFYRILVNFIKNF